ncbi:MAG: DsbA family protein [Actinomycetota bacterium]|nr:DsbA family protein [Actinomycetota bacterium]
MEFDCYIDFTCGYSYRAWLWFERLRNAGTDLVISWRSFVLKEVNRGEDAPSLLSGPTIESVAVLALAVAKALPDDASAAVYRSRVFDAMHAREERATRDDVIHIATAVGLDADSFWADETLWLAEVRNEHMEAVQRHGVFGTPTLVFDDDASMYLKLTDLPSENDIDLWDSVTTIVRSFPEVAELKRPSFSR